MAPAFCPMGCGALTVIVGVTLVTVTTMEAARGALEPLSATTARVQLPTSSSSGVPLMAPLCASTLTQSQLLLLSRCQLWAAGLSPGETLGVQL